MRSPPLGSVTRVSALYVLARLLQRCGQRVATHDLDHDEGNAYARLGEMLTRLGRKDEARAIYEKGIGQSEQHGHSGMAEDLRLAIIQLN